MDRTDRIVRFTPQRLGLAAAVILTGLVVVHGIFLPNYAHNETPQPGTLRLIRGNDIGLQWHQDARVEMESARDFPRQLEGRSRMRRNRPVYSGVGSLIYRCVEPFAIDDRSSRNDRARVAAWCLIGINAACLIATVALLFDATRRWFGPDAASIAVLLLLSLRFMHRYAAECLTHIYIHLPAALLLWLAVRGGQDGRSDDRRGWAAAFGWGVLFGVFYMTKQNVAVAASLFAVFLLLRTWRSALAYAAGLPWAYALWRVLIHWAGIPYANIEMGRYRQGVWVLEDLGGGRIGRLFEGALDVLRYMPGVLWRHFGWIVPLAAVGAWLVVRRGSASDRLKAALFAGVLAACTFAQTYASLCYTKRYIWAELYIVLCPLAGVALAMAGERLARNSRYPDVARLLLPAAVVTVHAVVEYHRLTRGLLTGWPVAAYGATVALVSVLFIMSVRIVSAGSVAPADSASASDQGVQ